LKNWRFVLVPEDELIRVGAGRNRPERNELRVGTRRWAHDAAENFDCGADRGAIDYGGWDKCTGEAGVLDASGNDVVRCWVRRREGNGSLSRKRWSTEEYRCDEYALRGTDEPSDHATP